jgi:hypothetical protein
VGCPGDSRLRRTFKGECRKDTKIATTAPTRQSIGDKCRQFSGMACLKAADDRYFGPLLPKVFVGTAGLAVFGPGSIDKLCIRGDAKRWQSSILEASRKRS